MSEDIKRPALRLHLAEFWRALKERYQARNILNSYSAKPVQNKNSVLVIPGFMASDTSTAFLRKVLKETGHKAFDWGLGRNYARLEEIDLIEKLLVKISEETSEKVYLIGWSLGGLYARKIAKSRPDLIQKVITLGSPYRHLNAPNYANWLFQLLQKRRGLEGKQPEWVEDLPKPVPVDSVAIYSKSDGIVPWEACMDEEDVDGHTNIEVNSSHIGMGMNKEVIKYILDELVAGSF